MSKRVIRINELASRPGNPGKLPASPATIWRWVRQGTFPAPFKLAPGTTVWDLDQVDKFLEGKAGGRH